MIVTSEGGTEPATGTPPLEPGEDVHNAAPQEAPEDRQKEDISSDNVVAPVHVRIPDASQVVPSLGRLNNTPGGDVPDQGSENTFSYAAHYAAPENPVKAAFASVVLKPLGAIVAASFGFVQDVGDILTGAMSLIASLFGL